MQIKPIKTRILNPPQDDLLEAISKSLKRIPESSVLAITSKVVSIWEGRCIPTADIEKDKLIKQEANLYIDRDAVPGEWVMHTIKNNLMIPSAGIDESNANNHYILWPEDPVSSAKKLWQWIREKYKVSNVGVVIVDSHTIPLRRGTMGISLSHYGFKPLKDYRGKKDLFGRKNKISQLNIPDGLASTAIFAMGENNEQTPLTLITDIPHIVFTDKPFKTKKRFSSFEITTKEDLYYPLIKNTKWHKGKGGKGGKK
ncbi:MAG: coenzyme F420-0:L-glutamate ligase [Parcubacteria group bacterium]